MILLIDNFDSFVYNIAQYVEELGHEVNVLRNNALSIDMAEALKPSHIIISPGPGRPENTGISIDIIKHFAESIPILGICLGLQCIAAVYGAKIIHTKKIFHGKASTIHHHRKGVFKNLAKTFQAVRYHSLVVEEESLPENFIISARSENNEIMGLEHRNYPLLHGVQFHPESFLTDNGHQLIQNFLQYSAPQLSQGQKYE